MCCYNRTAHIENDIIYYLFLTFCLIINCLTPELPQHGVPRPRAPGHNIIFNSLFLNFQSDSSALPE